MIPTIMGVIAIKIMRTCKWIQFHMRMYQCLELIMAER